MSHSRLRLVMNRQIGLSWWCTCRYIFFVIEIALYSDFLEDEIHIMLLFAITVAILHIHQVV